jgi:hypothetical protein
LPAIYGDGRAIFWVERFVFYGINISLKKNSKQVYTKLKKED